MMQLFCAIQWRRRFNFALNKHKILVTALLVFVSFLILPNFQYTRILDNSANIIFHFSINIHTKINNSNLYRVYINVDLSFYIQVVLIFMWVVANEFLVYIRQIFNYFQFVKFGLIAMRSFIWNLAVHNKSTISKDFVNF